MEVEWPGQARFRPVKNDNLRVYPLGPNVTHAPPSFVGQRVIVIQGKYAGKLGTLTQRTGPKLSITLGDGTVCTINEGSAHSVAAATATVTADDGQDAAQMPDSQELQVSKRMSQSLFVLRQPLFLIRHGVLMLAEVRHDATAIP